MKEAFIVGFVKAAVDLGLDDDTITRVFKRAMANPVGAQMFNQLPQAPQVQPPNPMHLQQLAQQNPQQLAIIKQLLAAQTQGLQPQGA